MGILLLDKQRGKWEDFFGQREYNSNKKIELIRKKVARDL